MLGLRLAFLCEASRKLNLKRNKRQRASATRHRATDRCRLVWVAWNLAGKQVGTFSLG